jgi:hypothetical protein
VSWLFPIAARPSSPMPGAPALGAWRGQRLVVVTQCVPSVPRPIALTPKELRTMMSRGAPRAAGFEPAPRPRADGSLLYSPPTDTVVFVFTMGKT